MAFLTENKDNQELLDTYIQVIKQLLDALQQAQFCMLITAQMLNNFADKITEAIKKAGINVREE